MLSTRNTPIQKYPACLMSVSTPWFCISCHEAAPAPEKSWDLQCMNAFDLLMRMISHTLNQSKQFLKALHHQQLISGMKPDTLAKNQVYTHVFKVFWTPINTFANSKWLHIYIYCIYLYDFMSTWTKYEQTHISTSEMARWGVASILNNFLLEVIVGSTRKTMSKNKQLGWCTLPPLFMIQTSWNISKTVNQDNAKTNAVNSTIFVITLSLSSNPNLEAPQIPDLEMHSLFGCGSTGFISPFGPPTGHILWEFDHFIILDATLKGFPWQEICH